MFDNILKSKLKDRECLEKYYIFLYSEREAPKNDIVFGQLLLNSVFHLKGSLCKCHIVKCYRKQM